MHLCFRQAVGATQMETPVDGEIFSFLVACGSRFRFAGESVLGRRSQESRITHDLAKLWMGA